jgi:hypothetical protein
LHLNGLTGANELEEAARWLRIAAEAGDRASQVDFANLLLDGQGDTQDSAKIAQWFTTSALEGDRVAALNLAVCLARGIGVSADPELAAQWLRYAADDVAAAQLLYGRVLAEGRGVTRDPEAAREWIARAAQAGLPAAEVALGEMMVNWQGFQRPAGAQDIGQQMDDPVPIALVGDYPGEFVGDTQPPLRLGEEHHSAVRGDPPAIEGGANLLTR